MAACSNNQRLPSQISKSVACNPRGCSKLSSRAGVGVYFIYPQEGTSGRVSEQPDFVQSYMHRCILA